MSLVSYAVSSDEDSDSGEGIEGNEDATVELPKQQPQISNPTEVLSTVVTYNGHISDDDDDFTPVRAELQQLKKSSLSLPPPKSTESEAVKQIEEDRITFAQLPTPRSCNSSKSDLIVEEDDEFLHKKAVPSAHEDQQKPSTVTQLARGPVKITIPSLKEFSDVDQELAHKAKIKPVCVSAPKGSGLLSILPKAKSEQDFSKTSKNPVPNSNSTTASAKLALIPDTVMRHRPALNTEGVDGLKAVSKKSLTRTETPKVSLADCSDSEASDHENDSSEDFFSLHATEALPEVSANEINVMVAKRAAEMAETANKYFNCIPTAKGEGDQQDDEEEQSKLQAQKRYKDQQDLDEEAMAALVGGSSAKRRRQQKEIKFVELSSADVQPNRDEWMRTALASSTEYQPTGVLVDEEPVSGTRRKHQITYLAHKAKANEAELQAMWAANRQVRRATQSKYGF